MMLLSTAALLPSGLAATTWANFNLFQQSAILFYSLVAIALWHAPIYGWALLISGWARRATFLWAVLPLLAIGFFEKITFNTSHFASMLKDRVMEPRGFADAVREVGRGGSALDPEVVAQMLDRRRRGGPLDELSERELDALAGMAEGRSNAAIATALGISESALQRDVASIFSKLGLPDDVEGHRRVLAVLTYIRAQEG